jgi:hypothetical protein
MIRLLIWIGFVRRDRSGKIVWPFRAPPKWMWKHWSDIKAYWYFYGWKPYRFRNLPGVIKWVPGRLLPRRWGFGWLGFEFGDRGG